MQTTSRKCEQFTDSVIRRMTRIAIDCNAINLAQGFPDFDPPKALTDRLQEISQMGPHQYPITMGAPNFRAALAKKCERFMGRKLDPNTDMVVTIGSTEAMVDSIFALTNPGDKIIMFSPYFENYRAQAIMADCEPIFVPLVPPTFHFDADVLEDAFVIRKERWLIPAGALTLEVDVFPFWAHQAFCEAELTEENQPVELPAWMELLREVTDEDGYTNHALARHIPAEDEAAL